MACRARSLPPFLGFIHGTEGNRGTNGKRLLNYGTGSYPYGALAKAWQTALENSLQSGTGADPDVQHAVPAVENVFAIHRAPCRRNRRAMADEVDGLCTPASGAQAGPRGHHSYRDPGTYADRSPFLAVSMILPSDRSAGKNIWSSTRNSACNDVTLLGYGMCSASVSGPPFISKRTGAAK